MTTTQIILLTVVGPVISLDLLLTGYLLVRLFKRKGGPTLLEDASSLPNLVLKRFAPIERWADEAGFDSFGWEGGTAEKQPSRVYRNWVSPCRQIILAAGPVRTAEQPAAPSLMFTSWLTDDEELRTRSAMPDTSREPEEGVDDLSLPECKDPAALLEVHIARMAAMDPEQIAAAPADAPSYIAYRARLDDRDWQDMLDQNMMTRFGGRYRFTWAFAFRRLFTKPLIIYALVLGAKHRRALRRERARLEELGLPDHWKRPRKLAKV